jgi:hyperosmotically inducible protein
MTKMLGYVLCATSLASAASNVGELRPVENRIRQELVRMPFLSLYDDLSFSVDNDGNVILSGETIRPTIRTDAERLVRRVEGVAAVENRIEVLPLSPFDNGIRVRVARAVYSSPALNRYLLNPNPPIRIIVRDGNVTLKGIVANEGDRNIAGIMANSVAGAFSVTNELRVDRTEDLTARLGR